MYNARLPTENDKCFELAAPKIADISKQHAKTFFASLFKHSKKSKKMHHFGKTI